MAKHATRSSTKGSESRRARRLTAEARKTSILQAARRAFTETGDMNGTTIRHIAERGGISEAVIYRHFESKDQLFIEAVVEPLTDAVDKAGWRSPRWSTGTSRSHPSGRSRP